MYSMKDGKNRSGGTSGMMVKKENKNSKNENCSMKGREHDEPNAPLFFLPRLELFCCPLPFRSVMEELKQRSFCLIASTFSIFMK